MGSSDFIPRPADSLLLQDLMFLRTDKGIVGKKCTFSRLLVPGMAYQLFLHVFILSVVLITVQKSTSVLIDIEELQTKHEENSSKSRQLEG